MSEQPSVPLKRYDVTRSQVLSLAEELTAAQQRVAFLTEQCRELSKTNAEFSEGNQRLLQRVAELERRVESVDVFAKDANSRYLKWFHKSIETKKLNKDLAADNARLQARVAELESLK